MHTKSNHTGRAYGHIPMPTKIHGHTYTLDTNMGFPNGTHYKVFNSCTPHHGAHRCLVSKKLQDKLAKY